MDEKMKAYAKELSDKSEKLREELIELENTFNIKKEEFLKIQGALEAIQAMGKDNS